MIVQARISDPAGPMEIKIVGEIVVYYGAERERLGGGMLGEPVVVRGRTLIAVANEGPPFDLRFFEVVA